MGATPANQWKGKINTEGVELEVPSGNTVLAQNLSPAAFMASGMMPDPLTDMIRKAINTKRGLPPSAMKGITDDPRQLGAALETFDRVLTYCVIEPEIKMPPGCDVEINDKECGAMISAPIHQNATASGQHAFHPGPRDPDELYADQVDMEDKMFVFQWALGGTSDLLEFRDQQDRNLELVSDGKDVQPATKRAARSKE